MLKLPTRQLTQASPKLHRAAVAAWSCLFEAAYSAVHDWLSGLDDGMARLRHIDSSNGRLGCADSFEAACSAAHCQAIRGVRSLFILRSGFGPPAPNFRRLTSGSREIVHKDAASTTRIAEASGTSAGFTRRLKSPAQSAERAGHWSSPTSGAILFRSPPSLRAVNFGMRAPVGGSSQDRLFSCEEMTG